MVIIVFKITYCRLQLQIVITKTHFIMQSILLQKQSLWVYKIYMTKSNWSNYNWVITTNKPYRSKPSEARQYQQAHLENFLCSNPNPMPPLVFGVKHTHTLDNQNIQLLRKQETKQDRESDDEISR